MFNDHKVIVVMPAYNAAKTLQRTHAEVVAQDYVDQVIVVDDGSVDETVAIAETLPNTKVHVHPRNQYTPKLIPAMVTMIGNGLYHCVLGSRILGGYALQGGMPLWKYIANRFLTLVENILLGAKLSEYHTGYRAFSRNLLEQVDLELNSDDFVFDNQMLAQILWFGHTIAEVSCPTKYFAEASSINLPRSIKYGFGCLLTAFEFRLARMGLLKSKRFPQPQN